MTVSVLHKARVARKPFPHVVIEECLPWPLYCELLRTRLSYKAILGTRHPGSNRRVDVNAGALLSWPKLPNVWREFIDFHTSDVFWKEICEKFELGGSELSTGVRFQGNHDISLDCQIGVNTPVLEKSSVRGPHVDNPIEVFGGLLYMGEDQKGGDLVIYEPVKPILFKGKAELDDSRVRPVKRVKYAHNTFVGFINLQHSIHGVTEREVTSEPRRLVNIIAEQKNPRFDLPREST